MGLGSVQSRHPVHSQGRIDTLPPRKEIRISQFVQFGGNVPKHVSDFAFHVWVGGHDKHTDSGGLPFGGGAADFLCRTLGNGGTKNQRVGLIGNVGLENVTGIFVVVVIFAFVVDGAVNELIELLFVDWFVCCVYTNRREEER